MKIDYCIVGCGLASISFCELLRKHNKSFVVFDNQSQQSSIVAAGLYNPVILKRFSEVWKAKEQLLIALPIYKELEKLLDVKLDYKLPIYRRFTSVEEQNQWFQASDKPNLESFLSINLIKNSNNFINAPFGFGEVLQSGRIDTKALISKYRNYLRDNNQLVEETFIYEELKQNESYLQYKDINFKQIVFAEGFGVKQNPFFKDLPLKETKGEVLLIKAPDLKINYGIKSSVFIVPVENHLYAVGATYNWDDKTQLPTKEAKSQLVKKLKTLISCDFDIVEHLAGIRPTVKDRRPLVGKHRDYKNMYVLNGLGTRGVMIGPYVAKQLYDFIENNYPLDDEININRFKK
jgi:glycine/D-amino acid oxidase-like deaminating enzyme